MLLGTLSDEGLSVKMATVLFDNYLIHHRHHHFVIIVSFGLLFMPLTFTYRVLGVGLDPGFQVLVNIVTYCWRQQQKTDARSAVVLLQLLRMRRSSDVSCQ